ncbi:MAG TPA: hypothetical protein VE057_01760 [Archangium sp.]|nr:hypothetical protein [Archangium sp.]
MAKGVLDMSAEARVAGSEDVSLGELDDALEQLREERIQQTLSPEEEAMFAAFKAKRTPSLEDLVDVVRHNPGLKITLSFDE